MQELRLDRPWAIILAGGQGTRLRSLHPELPKSLVAVAGKPILEWVLGQFAGQGVRNFVISLGHGADLVLQYLARRPADGLSIVTVVEPRPLGTGGAVRFAAAAIADEDPLLVANGDSLVLADLGAARTRLEASGADAALLVATVEDAARYGSIEVDDGGWLAGFEEKRSGYGLVNAGIYLFRRRVLRLFPERIPLSLEAEVFPALLSGGAKITVCPCPGKLLDMGTPEGLRQAEDFLQNSTEGGASGGHQQDAISG
jgi:NDP-sugar pyrophosphorylase family protein